jgi:hypothetical protein
MDLSEDEKATMQEPAVYRIRVEGLLSLTQTDRLLGMQITASRDDGRECSVVVGRLPDQSALSGVLCTLYELGYPVLSLECLELG